MSRAKRIAVLIACIAFSALCSLALRRSAGNVMLMSDFGEIYFGSRAALHGQDPYNPDSLWNYELKQLATEGLKLPANSAEAEMARIVLTMDRNLPTTLFLLIPVAVFPVAIAQYIWMFLLCGLLALAAFLVWDLGGAAAPDVWLLGAGFLLLNCQGLLVDGNAAGISVGLSVIAAWCFLRERHQMIGALILAVALAIKPHDAGLIWLYFLIAGGLLRKRALQALAILAALSLCAVLWIARASPQWIRHLHANLAATAASGTLNNPALSANANNGAGQIVDLQTVLSIFWNHPLFYNLTTYFIVGTLIIVWALAALRKRATLEGAQFALASISALSMLPLYHRSNDAKLLLLAIPACAVLWTRKGATRWIALALTSASIFFTADMPLAILGELTRNLTSVPTTLTGKLVTIFLRRPTPLVLLATGCFYLWVYLRYSPRTESAAPDDAATNALTAEAAT